MMQRVSTEGSSSRVNAVNGCDDKRSELLLTQAVKGKKLMRKKSSGRGGGGEKKYREFDLG